jgi:hypothetical protein
MVMAMRLREADDGLSPCRERDTTKGCSPIETQPISDFLAERTQKGPESSAERELSEVINQLQPAQ